ARHRRRRDVGGEGGVGCGPVVDGEQRDDAVDERGGGPARPGDAVRSSAAGEGRGDVANGADEGQCRPQEDEPLVDHRRTLTAPTRKPFTTAAVVNSVRYLICIPEMARETTSCWICSVPSKMS